MGYHSVPWDICPGTVCKQLGDGGAKIRTAGYERRGAGRGVTVCAPRCDPDVRERPGTREHKGWASDAVGVAAISCVPGFEGLERGFLGSASERRAIKQGSVQHVRW